MTNQEAIKILDNLKPGDYSNPYEKGEAIVMAISALQAQELANNSPKLDNNFSQENQKISQGISQWIPVSERLPDDLGDYLVSIKRIGWNMEEYVENDIAYWDDLEGFHKADEVIAWMPLPEPYRAERRTDEGD